MSWNPALCGCPDKIGLDATQTLIIPPARSIDGIDLRPHPHIGIGADQVITLGALNWMVAVRGVTHSERTSAAGRKGPRYIWWNFVASSRERIDEAKRQWRGTLVIGPVRPAAHRRGRTCPTDGKELTHDDQDRAGRAGFLVLGPDGAELVREIRRNRPGHP